MADFRNSRDEKKADVLVAVFERAVEATQLLTVLFFLGCIEGVVDWFVVFVN